MSIFKTALAATVAIATTLGAHELIIDNFAGGGGASCGIEMGLGRAPDYAINHDPMALAMHQANHPNTVHLCEDVFAVSPRELCAGRPVGLAWFSPNCTHFSKAKGGKPLDRKIRGLAWVVVKWAKQVKPRVVMLENVEEWRSWGPLLKNGKPDKVRKGLYFRKWCNALRAQGYELDFRELRGCDYGAPTTRKRLFLVARCDGEAIAWPEPTYGPGRAHPYRTAADCIDWKIPCPSIFGRAKPLAENTLKRIARGIERYVVKNPTPFIVGVGGRMGCSPERTTDRPLQTLTTKADAAVVVPCVARIGQTSRNGKSENGVDEPLSTLVTKAEHLLVAPTMVQVSYGEREGQAPRCLDIEAPLGTIVAGGIKHALVAPYIAKHFGDTGQRPGSAIGEPLDTITTSDHNALVTSNLVHLRGGLEDHANTAQAVTDPFPTVTAGGTHIAEARAFLIKYNGQEGWPELTGPLHTVPTHDRFGLVMIHGEPWVITDIGMRMLSPRELFRAQGFPDTYRIEVPYDIVAGQRTQKRHRKTLSKTAQVRMVGNSVCPQLAAALVRANFTASAAPANAGTWSPGRYRASQQLSLFDLMQEGA